MGVYVTPPLCCSPTSLGKQPKNPLIQYEYNRIGRCLLCGGKIVWELSETPKEGVDECAKNTKVCSGDTKNGHTFMMFQA